MNKVSCIRILLLGICLGFPSKQENVCSACQAQDNRKASPSRRVLRFPSNQSVGVLRVGRLKGPNVDSDFEEHRRIAAKGNIEVSEEDFLELHVGSVDDLEFLKQLSPGALQGLTITGLEINRIALGWITRLEGLESLRFDRCEFNEDTFVDAMSVSSLRAIIVYSTSFDRLTFAGWHLVLYPSNIGGADLTPFKIQLASSILKLPRLKNIPQILKPNLPTLVQIIARTSIGPTCVN